MNIFEKIIAGEIPCDKEYEDDHTLAFHDIDPQAPVHILVIPKKSGIQGLQDCDAETMGHMLAAVQNVAKRLKLDESGYRVVTNNGADAGQEVPHLHFHILGGARLGHIHHRDETHKKL